MLNENDLRQFTGTENYYRNPLHGRLVYTDGVRYLLEHGECYWLLDLIASYQPLIRKDPRLGQMHFWTLKVNPDKSAVLYCVADSGEKPAVSHEIEFTDFELPQIDIWVGNNGPEMVAMLKSEY